MSVLIKGMEMPKNCDECRIMVFEDTNCVPELFCGCPIVFKAHPQGVGHRPDYCPLVEVPPHGDLIEKNIIEKAINDACYECKDACIEFDGFFADCDQCILQRVKKALIDTPTVIPAEEATP